MNINGVSQGGQVSYNSQDIKINTESEDGKKSSGNDYSYEKGELSKKSIDNIAKKLDDVIGDFGVHSEYEIHDKLKDVMIKIVDDKTGNVISEIPPKKILDMIAKFCEMAGIIVDKRA